MKGEKFIPLALVVAALLAYQNSFQGPFIYDDGPSIVANSTIRHLWPIWQPLSPPHADGLTVEGRPLINLSLAINYAFGGINVWGYHAVNLLIHVLVGLALYGVVRRTLRLTQLRDRHDAGANGLALAVALLWMVHPLQTEAVTYVIQRAELIMSLFYLLTLYCFIRAAESPRPGWWQGLCVAACALGMASKEVMVTAPLMMLLYDRTFLSATFSEAWRRRWRLYLALAGTWIVLGYIMFPLNFGNMTSNAKSLGVTPWGYLLTEPSVILHYLRLCFWPHPLCFDYYGWPVPKTWTSFAVPTLAILFLLAATAWAVKKRHAWGFLNAWFFLILAPTSSFLPLDSPAYEHRLYLPLAGIIVLAVMAIHALAGRRTVIVILAVATAFGFLTWRRNLDYRSELAIWQDTVNKRPDNPRAHTNLGLALGHLDRLPEAITQYQQALRLQPNSATVRYNLEIAMARTGNPNEAIAHFAQALQIKPDSAEAHEGLGLAFAQAGRTEAAIEHFEQAIHLEPNNARVYNNLAVALIQAGKTQEAIDCWRRALQLEPNDAETQYNLGNALLSLGQAREAIEHWQKAVAINPDFAAAKDGLSRLLAALHQTNGVAVPQPETARPEKKEGGQ